MKVGVYVDEANVRGSGVSMRFSVLREWAERGNWEAQRLNAYTTRDVEREKDDQDHRLKAQRYRNTIRDSGWKVVDKAVSRYVSKEDGSIVTKANADIEIAIDVISQSRNLDKIILVTGDGDFVRLVGELQNRGCRVEVISFDNISRALIESADEFTNGYLIPGLGRSSNRLPGMPAVPLAWGKTGSRMRGTVYSWVEGKGYGFIRCLREISDEPWRGIDNASDSAWVSVFVHKSKLNGLRYDVLPHREVIVEFTMVEEDEKVFAEDVIAVYAAPSVGIETVPSAI